VVHVYVYVCNSRNYYSKEIIILVLKKTHKKHISMCFSCPCIWVGERSEGVIRKRKLIFENVLHLFMPMYVVKEKK
jgi:hypothetical protein